MAKKELTLVLRLKSMIASGLASAGKALHSFGSGMMRFGRGAAVAFGVAAGAVTAFAVKALSAYAVQEKASAGLSAALIANGEDAAAIVPKLNKAAAAIQDETGAADEATVAGMAQMRMLGVKADKLEEAAKATIALKSVGLEETAAQKAVAMAMQGSYDMLNRYVPALRTAKTETEKAAIVNDLFAKGYEQQKALLGTTSGAWAALKGRVGDVLEEFGRAIEKSGSLSKLLNRAGEAVKGFGQKISDWIDSEKFVALQQSISGIVSALGSGGKSRSEALGAIAEVLKSAFVVAVENVTSLLLKAAPTIGKMIGGAAKAVLSGPVMKGEFTRAGEQLGFKSSGKLFQTGFTKEQEVLIHQQVARNRQEKAFAELGIEAQDAVEGQTAAEYRLMLAMQRLGKIADDNAPALFVGPPEPPKGGVTIAGTTEQIKAQAEETEKLKDAQKALADLQAEEAAAVKEALADRWKAQQDEAEKELALAQELAGKKIAAFIQEAKDKKKIDNQAARDNSRDQKRADMLTERAANGGKLSKQQQAWLDAFNAIKGAKNNIPNLQNQIDVAKDNLAQLQLSNRNLADIRKDLAANNAVVNALLRAT